ncbi:hypothetical protein OG792_19730 [Micromonospora sp. NBC_01699]|nr:hypothetical protein [Micromonospora sp. NBC_01699]
MYGIEGLAGSGGHEYVRCSVKSITDARMTAWLSANRPDRADE